MTGQRVVRTLMGASSFENSVTCLRSVVVCSHEPIKLIVHEDGTLTDKYQDRLRAEVSPEIEFVIRKDADDAILPLLAKYPACLAYRRMAVMALKLFDTVLLSQDTVSYIDSDIYFRQMASKLFDPVETPVFMDNGTHSYAIRPWRAWPLSSVRLAGRINAGLMVSWTAGLDLEFLDWLLGRLSRDTVYHTRAIWVEQTCWAAMAARTCARLFDPRQVAMASKTMSNVTPETVAIHFVSTYRSALADYQSEVRSGQDPVEIRTIPTSRVNSLSLFWSDLRRRL